jgi:hypothetical protein
MTIQVQGFTTLTFKQIHKETRPQSMVMEILQKAKKKVKYHPGSSGFTNSTKANI